LGTAYKKDLSGFITYNKNNQIIEITAVATPNLNATAITNTANDHPVPPITIGQSYDFSAKPQLSPPLKPSPNPLPIPTVSTFQKISVSNPKEGEILTNTKPEFRGLGPAQKEIRLKLESPTAYSAEIRTDPNGSWNWTPPQNLEPGEHTITLEYTDENNQPKSLVRHFIVQAMEVVSPTPTPITPLPTISPTVSATPSPTSSAKKAIATQSAQVTSGNLTPLLFLVIVGISFIGLSLII